MRVFGISPGGRLDIVSRFYEKAHHRGRTASSKCKYSRPQKDLTASVEGGRLRFAAPICALQAVLNVDPSTGGPLVPGLPTTCLVDVCDHATREMRPVPEVWPFRCPDRVGTEDGETACNTCRLRMLRSRALFG